MTRPPTLCFYLEDGLRQSAEAGQHNFIGKVADICRESGFDIRFAPLGARPDPQVYALYHMVAPPHDRALTMRRVYYYPFWAIEPVAERWHWSVAQASFDPGMVQRPQANAFYERWQTRLFGDLACSTSRDGFVYVPLQGKLLRHRSFQTCAPIDMLKAVLEHDPRPVIATLHPKEVYSARERRKLSQLAERYPRLTVTTGRMEECLSGCDYVVTQNSSAAFAGYFFGKPAVLFARIDFHHIAANVAELGIRSALTDGPEMAPDYAGYVHWFWQVMSINAGHAGAEDQIRMRLKRAGWPM
ncbi:hypothetical protein [Thalassococcus sp. S3]|uniref:hypothetical protein n=1 Tax=Thalassococcus sp. S3 TaxID=2017482 RepID=UPI0010242100|nr:hypothetical protein [Thalassococcus sp. S3]QBF29611.1 hypothetical protein CFI11_00070 [Thalassococcus sp. S3]